jgi:hypothetical protein
LATLTATFDPVYARVGVQIDGFTDGVPVTITRDGDAVRSGVGVVPSSGSYFVWDYEAPFDVSVHYEATDGTLTATDDVTLPLTVAYLRAPGLPSLDREILPANVPAVSRPRPTAVLRPLGRRAPVVLSGTRSAGEFTLQVWARSATEADDIQALVDEAAVALLIMPRARGIARVYVSIADVEEQPITGYVDEEWSLWVLACVVVDSPVGDTTGDPTASYQAIVDAHSSYASLYAANDTYLDVLRGV